MKTENIIENFNSSIKFAFVLLVAIALRFIPHPPNVEPILTSLVPFGKKVSTLMLGMFGFLAIIVYDAANGQVGPWTIFTATAYLLVAVGYSLFIKKFKNPGAIKLASFAIVATLFYDITTMFAFGKIFSYPLPILITGQIPFTLLHIASNVFGVLVISPLISKYIVENPSIDIIATKTESAEITL